MVKIIQTDKITKGEVLKDLFQTSHNTDYDPESKKDSSPQREICLHCMGEGVRVSPNPNMDGEYEDCPHCKSEGFYNEIVIDEAIKMKNKLKLFVWEDVLSDFTSGIAFAIAETEQEAREILLNKESCLASDASFNGHKPKVYNDKMCYTLWGGG